MAVAVVICAQTSFAINRGFRNKTLKISTPEFDRLLIRFAVAVLVLAVAGWVAVYIER